jgi:hypothetical protein
MATFQLSNHVDDSWYIAVSIKQGVAAQVGFPHDLVQIVNGPRQGSEHTCQHNIWAGVQI